MKASELRQKYLDFFSSNGHKIVPSASLIPENDPTVLFTTAGMHPLVPYLMGEKHPAGRRLVSCQKCIRTSDIDEVGDATHHTFFEMLGNWSLGDYFKKEAIEWSWEFLTSPEWLGLNKDKIAISVFTGDKDAPRDDKAVKIWLEISSGELKDRIDYLPKEKNWWGPAGLTGPCGPDTEMFYWIGSEPVPKKVRPGDLAEHPNWVEIWNDVFMQYNKKADGSFEALKQQNVDTGMGLERTIAVLNGLDDDYQTDLFKNIIHKIEQLSGKEYGQTDDVNKAMRIIADHIKAATFIMADDRGIVPSNTDQGYVVRRLIRRAIRYGRQLDINEISWTKEIAKVVAHDYGDVYPEVRKNIDSIINNLNQEENKFNKTLEQGIKEFRNIIETKMNDVTMDKRLSSHSVFTLYTSYGFPIELIMEMAKEKGLDVDLKAFERNMRQHQELSRTASAGMFKGGLADASEQTKKLHTAAHLLLAALRKVLGNHVIQKGSNITAERLRFDFAHKEKMTDEEKRQVEEMVNQAIKQNLSVTCEEMDLDQAREKGAHGIFENKYGEKVTVYTIGDEPLYFSKEICGGPHVNKTGELGQFKIQKEESSSAGVRRIKAILI